MDYLFEIVRPLGRIFFLNDSFGKQPVENQQIDDAGQPADRLHKSEDEQSFIGRQPINVINDNDKARFLLRERFG